MKTPDNYLTHLERRALLLGRRQGLLRGAFLAGTLGLVLGYAGHIAKVQLAGPAPEPSRVTAADPRASVVESIKAYSLRTGTRPIFIRDAYCFLMPEPGEVAGR